MKIIIIHALQISFFFFKDPCRNLMRKWNGINTVNGVFSDEFQLSDLPILGVWNITATLSNGQVKSYSEKKNIENHLFIIQ